DRRQRGACVRPSGRTCARDAAFPRFPQPPELPVNGSPSRRAVPFPDDLRIWRSALSGARGAGRGARGAGRGALGAGRGARGAGRGARGAGRGARGAGRGIILRTVRLATSTLTTLDARLAVAKREPSVRQWEVMQWGVLLLRCAHPRVPRPASAVPRPPSPVPG